MTSLSLISIQKSSVSIKKNHFWKWNLDSGWFKKWNLKSLNIFSKFSSKSGSNRITYIFEALEQLSNKYIRYIQNRLKNCQIPCNFTHKICEYKILDSSQLVASLPWIYYIVHYNFVFYFIMFMFTKGKCIWYFVYFFCILNIGNFLSCCDGTLAAIQLI